MQRALAKLDLARSRRGYLTNGVAAPQESSAAQPTSQPAAPPATRATSQRAPPSTTTSSSAPRPPHLENTFWTVKADAKLLLRRSSEPSHTPKSTHGLPEALQRTAAAFQDTCSRLSSALDLIELYPSIHRSKYAPVTSNSRAIPARDRILYCSPPAGCPVKPRPIFIERPELNYRAGLVRAAAGGANGYAQTGYALKCFMLWALTHDIPDERLMPLQADVLEAYIASLAGYFSKKVITSRISHLRKWHLFYDVEWSIRPEDLEIALDGVGRLAPYGKIKREPLLIDQLLKMREHLDMNNSFDVAFWAATTFAHRACLRSGEFTIPSQAAFSTSKHISIANLSIVYTNGVPKGIEAHLPWDKVNHGRGADVSVTALPQGHLACPVVALLRHLELNKPAAGEPLFSFTSSRPASIGQRMGLSKAAWRARLHECLAAANLPPMSGHTVRIGGATQMLLDGVDPLVVKVVGRWKSDAFEVYWRNITSILATFASKRAPANAPSKETPENLIEELESLAGLRAVED